MDFENEIETECLCDSLPVCSTFLYLRNVSGLSESLLTVAIDGKIPHLIVRRGCCSSSTRLTPSSSDNNFPVPLYLWLGKTVLLCIVKPKPSYMHFSSEDKPENDRTDPWTTCRCIHYMFLSCPSNSMPLIASLRSGPLSGLDSIAFSNSDYSKVLISRLTLSDVIGVTATFLT